MAAPAFVNFGAVGGVGFGTGFSNEGLPASRVNGNILIIVATVANGTARTMAISGGGGGWSIIGTPDVSTNGNSLVAYRIVDGTEAAPSITWTGNDNGCGVILQYSGDFSSNPIGNIHQNALSVANATMTESGITLARGNSLVLGIVLGSGSPATISTPPGGSWTQDQVNTAGLGTLAVWDNSSVATQGSHSPSFSATMNFSAKWMAYTIEIASQAPITPVAAAGAVGLTMTAAVVAAGVTQRKQPVVCLTN
jgi:hypothetical protein